MRVIAALSGGVDSAVATARLLEAGHDVVGVHLDLYRTDRADIANLRGCASLTHTDDAKAVADLLGINFEVWDFTDDFVELVVDDFFAEYKAGRTPNPCLRCNEKIKFAKVIERGIELGFDAMATGHYARLVRNGEVELHRAVDHGKDQSYVLAVLDQHHLSHCLFPLGDSLKTDVRAEAAALGLAVADKPDSTDICFIPNGDTAGFLARELGTMPGEIVDTAGDVVGQHQGYHQFTIGQRRGLRLGVPAVDGKPRFVLGIEPATNRVIVGGADDLLVNHLRGIRPTWTQSPATEAPTRGLAQVRAHGAALPCTYALVDGEFIVTLDEPIKGVAPGQSVVLYDETRVVGGAIITLARLELGS